MPPLPPHQQGAASSLGPARGSSLPPLSFASSITYDDGESAAEERGRPTPLPPPPPSPPTDTTNTTPPTGRSSGMFVAPAPRRVISELQVRVALAFVLMMSVGGSVEDGTRLLSTDAVHAIMGEPTNEQVSAGKGSVAGTGDDDDGEEGDAMPAPTRLQAAKTGA